LQFSDKYSIKVVNEFDDDEFLVSVSASWTDTRIVSEDEDGENGEGVSESVKIQASFPDISGSCE
jgi:hypothetical protein